MLLGGLIVGGIVGWLSGMWWANRPSGPPGPPIQFFRHKKTGDEYRLECRAIMADRPHIDTVVLLHFGRDAHRHSYWQNEVWPADALATEFEAYVPDLLKATQQR